MEFFTFKELFYGIFLNIYKDVYFPNFLKDQSEMWYIFLKIKPVLIKEQESWKCKAVVLKFICSLLKLLDIFHM